MNNAHGHVPQLFGPNGAPAGSTPEIVVPGQASSPRGAAFGKIARAEAKAAEALEMNRILQEKAEQAIARTVHDVRAAFAMMILKANGPVFVSDADWLEAKRHAGSVSEIPLPLPVGPAEGTEGALPVPGRWVGFVQLQPASTVPDSTLPGETAMSEATEPGPAPDAAEDPGESTESS